MGCNEISTDLVWEGNSSWQRNVKVLKMFCYETVTFVSRRNCSSGVFKRLNSKVVTLSHPQPQ